MADQMQSHQNIFIYPHIVKKLFQFLPAKSLCSVASVCREWEAQAKVVLAQRRQYSWELFQEDEESVTDKMKRYFEEEISIRPRLVVVFLTKGLFRQLRQFDNRKRKRGDDQMNFDNNVSLNKFHGFCSAVMPTKCQVFCSVTPGIIGTSSDRKCVAEKESGVNASVVCFGRYPRVDVSLLTMVSEQLEQEEVKLMLLMSSLNLDGVSSIRAIRRRLPSPLILGGDNSKSYVYSFVQTQTVGESSPCLVVFQGQEVQVASVKLDEKVDSDSKAEKGIFRLKEKTQHFNMENSLAFMFACVERGTRIYNTPNVESSLFHKHFPNTPLVGFFGNGEVGSEYPYLTGSAPQREIHGYTTFIAVLSLP